MSKDSRKITGRFTAVGILVAGIAGFVLLRVLAVLLLAGPFGSLLHAYEHEPGNPTSEVCSDCITFAQLDLTVVVNHTAPDLETARGAFAATSRDDFQSYCTFAARQRGPPAIG